MDREERIRRRAHGIWEEEGRPDGRANDHWQRAFREIEDELRREEDSHQSGSNEVPAANIVVHEGPTSGAPLPGLEPADGITTPGVRAQKPKPRRRR